MCIVWFDIRCLFCSRGLHIRPAPRTPPSHNVFLTPRSGQFDAAFELKPSAGPPLSVLKTIMESFSIFLVSRARTTAPTESSRCVTIAEQIKMMLCSSICYSKLMIVIYQQICDDWSWQFSWIAQLLHLERATDYMDYPSAQLREPYKGTAVWLRCAT